MKVYSTPDTAPCSNEKCAALRKIPFFALFKSDEELCQVLSYGNWMECPADTPLIHEGSVESTMFVLVRGEVLVQKKGKPLSLVKAPGTVGEIGAFLDTPRTADVFTKDTATIFGLNVKHLSKLPSETLYRVMEHLFRVTAVRLVHTDQRMASL